GRTRGGTAASGGGTTRRGTQMRQRLMVVIACLGLAGTIPAIPADGAQAPRSGATAASACVYGTVAGQRKCLRRGEYCSRRYERDYERYGFRCTKLDSRGSWHLQ